MREEFRQFVLSEYGLPSPFMVEPKKKEMVGKWRYRYDFRRPFEELVKGMLPAHNHGNPGAKITVHTMRHTFASLLVSAGKSIYKVAGWLGNGIRVTEERYAYLVP